MHLLNFKRTILSRLAHSASNGAFNCVFDLRPFGRGGGAGTHSMSNLKLNCHVQTPGGWRPNSSEKVNPSWMIFRLRHRSHVACSNNADERARVNFGSNPFSAKHRDRESPPRGTHSASEVTGLLKRSFSGEKKRFSGTTTQHYPSGLLEPLSALPLGVSKRVAPCAAGIGHADAQARELLRVTGVGCYFPLFFFFKNLT